MKYYEIRLYLDLTSFPLIFFLYSRGIFFYIIFICHIFSNLWQLCLSLFFMTLLMKRLRNYVECPSIWVCLMFSHDWTKAMNFGGKCHIREVPYIRLGGAWYPHESLLMMLKLTIWLKWSLSVSSLKTYYFLFLFSVLWKWVTKSSLYTKRRKLCSTS